MHFSPELSAIETNVIHCSAG